MGLLGIALGLALLIGLAFRSWSVLLLAPAAALLAALFAGEPLLAHWTQTFMDGTARFLAQFFPIFLLGALFGKLMDDSGSVSAIAAHMTRSLGERRAILAVVLAGALVTYGGVSLFVAFFVLAPMAQALFRAAAIPRRLMPAAIALGTSTFTMSALPGTPAIQNAIPMPFFGTTPFAAPGLGIIASAVMLGFGLWWLGRAEASARRAGEPFGAGDPPGVDAVADDQGLRERATTAREFDPAEIKHGVHGATAPPAGLAVLPLVVVVGVNLMMSLVVLPRLDVSRSAGERRRCPRWVAYGRSSPRSPRPSSRCWPSTGPVCRLCGKPWTPARTPRCCRRSASRAWWVSARWSRPCRPSRWSAIGCWASAAGLWSRWRRRPTCSPRSPAPPRVE
jgi:H+/gluconate symporter-like permease